MIHRLPDKSSGAYPMPTSVLKAVSDLLSPYVAALSNRSIHLAVDTVDHMIMLKRLERTFRVSGVALDWLSSYLVSREQFIRLGADSSRLARLRYRRAYRTVLYWVHC
jgi:hypothetical protein